MALIRHFKPKQIDRMSLHQEIQASYAVHEVDGRVLLQIDSYGRKDRKFPDKISQSFQLDQVGATALFKILKDSFGLK